MIFFFFFVGTMLQASHHGYTGPVNGILGPNSWAGTQRGLVDYGYTGPDNGVPGMFNFMLIDVHMVVILCKFQALTRTWPCSAWLPTMATQGQ
jgi:hypothetical protein